jgi:phosphoenolpyruvate carboxykinase (ATP)
MISAALNGEFDKTEFEELPIFRLRVPKSCSGVPAEILNPRLTWSDKAAFDQTAADLAGKFVKNFQQYADGASAEILAAAPSVPEVA